MFLSMNVVLHSRMSSAPRQNNSWASPLELENFGIASHYDNQIAERSLSVCGHVCLGSRTGVAVINRGQELERVLLEDAHIAALRACIFVLVQRVPMLWKRGAMY
eukprot:COSAG02_NODE_13729_length_1356_cov_3.349828_1_plen_105_part_00